jgi:symplekin
MIAIKQRILRIWDDAAPAVKLCCIKFAQRVVLAQTTATSMEKVRASLSYYTCTMSEWGY